MNQPDHEPRNPRQLIITKGGKTDFQIRKIKQEPARTNVRFKLSVLRIGRRQARYLFWSFYNLHVSSFHSVLLVV